MRRATAELSIIEVVSSSTRYLGLQHWPRSERASLTAARALVGAVARCALALRWGLRGGWPAAVVVKRLAACVLLLSCPARGDDSGGAQS